MHLQYSTSVPFNEQKNGKVIIEDPKDKNIHVCDFIEACEVVSSINSLLDVDARHIDVVNTESESKQERLERGHHAPARLICP